ncbi:MAG TPA: thiamine pyrophosphate-dependent enzyme, partial [Burkholderiales bacterium]|nr:thiamine pyrophosphate-dependent enzyme [Burkholderiales bacterium]
AMAMALGYAKATGKLPAVVVHTTVGAQHCTMIARSAVHERIPMVILAGEVIGFAEPPSQKVGRQWLRVLTDLGGPAALIESAVKWSFALNNPNILPQTIQRACQLAVSAPRGPVFVSVPTEYMIAEMAVEPPHASLPELPDVGEKALADMAAILGAARNPVIITEEAGRETAAVDALVALAETLGAPVFEAWQPYYVNFPHHHPLYGGVVVDDIPPGLSQADVVLLVESVLPWHPPSKIVDKKVLVLGEDPLHPRLPFWGFRADVIGTGNVTNALRDLSKRVPKSNRAGVTLREMSGPALSTVLDTAWVAHQLREAMPADAILVNETITHRLEIHKRLDKLAPGSFFEASYGGLGVGLGLALGVKYAHRNRPVVCTIGDGAFHYNPVVGSLGAAQEHGLPILVVLFNNSGYLSQKRDVSNYYPQGAAAKAGRVIGTPISPAVNYAKLAEAYGGYGEKVEKAADVAAAIQRGLKAVAKGQLALLDMTLAPI